MAIQADELTVSINLDVQDDATRQIGKIVSGIKALKNTAGGDTVTQFSDSIKTLAQSFDTLKNTNSSVASIGDSLKSLFDYLERFDGSKYMSGINTLNAALDKLGKGMETFVKRSTGLANAANGALYIQNAAMSLSGIQVPDDAKENLDKIADAIKRVSQYGTAFNNLTAGLKRIPEAIQGMSVPMSDQAFLTLTQTISKLNTAIAGLNRDSATAFTHVSQGIETLNKAGANADLATNLQEAAKATNDFIKEIGSGISDDVINRFYRLADAIDKVTQGYKNLNLARKGVNGAKNNLNNKPDVSEFQTFFTQLSGVIGKIPGGGNFANLSASIGELGTISSGAASGLAALGASVGVVVAVLVVLKKWVEDVNRVFDEHIKFLKEILSAIGTVASRIGSGLVSAFKQAEKGAKAFIGAIGNIVSAIADMRENIEDHFGSFSKALKKAFKALTNGIKQIVNTIMRMALRKVINAMFTQMKEALDRLVNYSRYAGTQFAKSMDMFATSIRYFGNSLIAMFSPVINAVMPILDKLVDKLADVMNHINEFISFMTGASTWTSAIKIPIEYATAAEKAAKKQKELNNTILGFDEINRLNGDKNSDDETEGLYEFKENPFGDWLTGIGNLTALFDGLVVRLSAFTDKLKSFLTAIDWEKVYKIAEEVGNGTMRLLNVIFGDSSFGRILGETLGKTLNTAFHYAKGMIDAWQPKLWALSLTNFVRGALESLDWGLIQADVMNIGNKLAVYFNAVFSDKTMWSEVGQAIRNGINTAILGVTTFVNEFGWAKLGNALGRMFQGTFDELDYVGAFTALSKIINGAFSALSSWLNTIDLPKIGKQIVNGITAGLKALDWNTIQTALNDLVYEITSTLNVLLSDNEFWTNAGTAIGNGITTLIGMAQTLVNTLNWKDFGSAIGTFFSNALNGIDWKTLGTTLGNLVNGLFVALGGFFKSFDGITLAQNIATGIKSALDALDWEEIKRTAVIVGAELGNFFNELASDAEMWGKVGEFLGNALNTAISGLASFLAKIDPIGLANSILTFFSSAVDTFINNPDSESGLNSIITWAADTINSLIDGWETSGLYEKIKGFLEKIDWGKLFTAISRLMVEIAITKLQIQFDTFWPRAMLWLHEKVEFIYKFLYKWGDKFLYLFGGLPGQTLVIFVKGAAMLSAAVTSNFGKIKTAVSEIFNDIKNTIKTTIEGARDIVEAAIEKIKGFFNFEWSLPKLKLPHFSISGEFSLDPPSVPHISVDWYKKAMEGGMIMNGATIFGVNSNGGLMGGGEAGPEAVVGTGSLSSMIQNSVNAAFSTQNLASAVAAGVAGAMNTAGASPTVDLTLKIDSETLYRMVRKGEASYNGRYHIIEGVT